MKNLFQKLIFLCFIAVSQSLTAQSVIINPNNLQIPSVSALPACAAVDYGKVVFLTTTNRANVCSGSGWVEVITGGGGGLTLPYTNTGSFSTQGFQIINTGGGSNSAALQGTTLSTLTDAAGVWGSANTTSPTGFNAGVRGTNFSTNNGGYGVFGSHGGGGYGVYGQSVTGYAVSGVATGSGGIGVAGASSQNNSTGIYGNVTGSFAVGVLGRASQVNSIAAHLENTNVSGLALSTIGKLRFQGNGAGVNKVLVSADASGNANWEALIRTEKLKLGPAAFVPSSSTIGFSIGTQGISLSNAGVLYANVSLPNGAILTQVKIYYIDNDGIAPSPGLGITNFLFQKLLHTSNNTYTNVVTSSPGNSTASTSIFTAFQNTTEVIDNQTSFYRVAVTMPASNNVILVGAEISYSYTVND